MQRAAMLDILRCPACRSQERLRLGGERHPDLLCTACLARYPIVEGIPDMAPPGPRPVKTYRTETLANLMAGTYDVALPAMSLLAWRCQPLRFVDFTHMAMGRAQGGTLLALPVATGWLVRHTWGEHLDVRVVAADLSWNMLRRAKKRLERAGIEPIVVRADPERLPFAPGAFDSVLSHNGLHDFDDRTAALAELYRVTSDEGLLAGSTLVRDHEGLTDRVLRLYERYGLAPMLRSKAFVLAELEALSEARIMHESYGAVLFFSVDRGRAPLRPARRATA